MKIKAYQNTTEVLQQREESLNLPTSFVKAQFLPVQCLRALSIRFLPRDQLGFKLCESFIKWIRIISFVANQLSRAFVGNAAQRVCSTSLTSCSAATFGWMAGGRPVPSAITLSFVPLPCLIFPTPKSYFSPL